MKRKNIIKRTSLLITLLAVVLMSLSSFTQYDDDDLDLPCGGDDPYARECPLDTWTTSLVAAGVAFGCVTLYRAQKAHSN